MRSSTRRTRVYIAGPLTTGGVNVRENLDAAEDALRKLSDLGYAPHCPHLNAYVDGATRHVIYRERLKADEWCADHDTWMEIDMAWLEAADVVLRLPGDSKGANKETEHATGLGIPVVYLEQLGGIERLPELVEPVSAASVGRIMAALEVSSDDGID